MAQNQSAQSDFSSQDVFNQLFDMLDQSAIHSVQPIELNFTDSPTDGSTGNTIQISMDCITMHEPDEMVSHIPVRSLHSESSICTFGLAESFMPDALPDTTLYFIRAGDRHKRPRSGSSCGYIVRQQREGCCLRTHIKLILEKRTLISNVPVLHAAK